MAAFNCAVYVALLLAVFSALTTTHAEKPMADDATHDDHETAARARHLGAIGGPFQGRGHGGGGGWGLGGRGGGEGRGSWGGNNGCGGGGGGGGMGGGPYVCYPAGCQQNCLESSFVILTRSSGVYPNYARHDHGGTNAEGSVHFQSDNKQTFDETSTATKN